MSGSNTNKPICKLCLGCTDLIEAHVVPGFMIREFLDDKFRAHVVNLDKKGKGAHYQTSKQIYHVKDPHLTCRDCDNRIGKWERYAKSLLYLNEGITRHTRQYFSPHRRKAVVSNEIGGIDYDQFRLFLLSLLWRASASNLAIVSSVSLGPFEDALRRLLLTGDPGEPSSFPCVLMPVTVDGRHEPGMIFLDRFKADRFTFYRFLIDRFFFLFFVSKQTAPSYFVENAISREGIMKTYDVELSELNYLLQSWKQFLENHGPVA